MNYVNVFREHLLHLSEEADLAVMNIVLEEYVRRLNIDKPVDIDSFLSMKIFNTTSNVLISAEDYLTRNNVTVDKMKFRATLFKWLENVGIKSLVKKSLPVAKVANVISLFISKDPSLLTDADKLKIEELVNTYKELCIQTDFSTFIKGLLEKGSTWSSSVDPAIPSIESAIADVGGAKKVTVDSKEYLGLFKAEQERKFSNWIFTKKNNKSEVLSKGTGEIYSVYIAENNLHLLKSEQRVLLSIVKSLSGNEDTDRAEAEHFKAGVDRVKEKYGELVETFLRSTVKPTGKLSFKQLQSISEIISNSHDDSDVAFNKAVNVVYPQGIEQAVETNALFNWIEDPEPKDFGQFNTSICSLMKSIKNEYGLEYEQTLKVIYNIDNSQLENSTIGMKRWEELGKELISIIDEYNKLVEEDDYYKKMDKERKICLMNDIGRNSMNSLQAIGAVTSLAGAGIGAFIPGGTLVSPLITGLGKWLRRAGKLGSNHYNTLDRKKRKDAMESDESIEKDKKLRRKHNKKDDKTVELGHKHKDDEDENSFGVS